MVDAILIKKLCVCGGDILLNFKMENCITRLNKENFAPWKIQIKMYMISLELYSIVEEIETAPNMKVKGKVFYGQEPPSGESTTTECGFNYQLLAVIYWSSPMGSS